MTFLAETAAATVAGVVTTVVGHPLDTIKVHLQANSAIKTTGDAGTHQILRPCQLNSITLPERTHQNVWCNTIKTVMIQLFVVLGIAAL